MKKLLCVLIFEMVFGQDAISTREYSVEVTPETTEINIMELIGEGQGYFNVKLLVVENLIINENENGNLDFTIASELSNGIRLGYNSLEDEDIWNTGFYNQDGDYIIINTEYPSIYFFYQPNMEYVEGTTFSGNLILRISGKFPDSDVGLQGDMNFDGDINVLDVIALVNVILDDDLGDIFDVIGLINKVG